MGRKSSKLSRPQVIFSTVWHGIDLVKSQNVSRKWRPKTRKGGRWWKISGWWTGLFSKQIYWTLVWAVKLSGRNRANLCSMAGFNRSSFTRLNFHGCICPPSLVTSPILLDNQDWIYQAFVPIFLLSFLLKKKWKKKNIRNNLLLYEREDKD